MPFRLVERFSCHATIAFLVLVLAACGKPENRPPNILMIVIDTLRADRLGGYENPRGLTPFLDELASRGVLFENAYAPSSWTCPAVASLFTSRYASQHHVTTFDSKLPEAEVTLAERLQTVGYRSAGFSANFRLTRELGYAQGFDQWQVFVASWMGKKKVRGDHLRHKALEWLDQAQKESPNAPKFLYLQYMEPHSPYVPPAPFRGRFGLPETNGLDAEAANEKLAKLDFKGLSEDEIRLLESLYDGETAAVDAEIRRLFEELDVRGFFDHSIVVVTSDHGEEFHEHGGMLHGFTLYNHDIRIPLIVLAPEAKVGHTVETHVSLVDLLPTVSELIGMPLDPAFEGRSFASLLRGQKTPSPDIVSELFPSGGSVDLRRHQSALVRDSLKLLVAPNGRLELYDLEEDPEEMKPNPADLADRSETLAGALADTRAELADRALPAAERGEVDEETKERLRALGYSL